MTGDEREHGRPLTPGEIAGATGLTQAREVRGKGGRVLKSNAGPPPGIHYLSPEHKAEVMARAEELMRSSATRWISARRLEITVEALREEVRRLIELTPSGYLMWRAESHEGRRPSMVHGDWTPELKRLLKKGVAE
jgi:hypothetical protein